MIYNYRGDDLLEAVQILLEAGINVNAQTSFGWNSVLTLVIQQLNHRKFFLTLKLLIEKGADINLTDGDRSNSLILLGQNYKGRT